MKPQAIENRINAMNAVHAYLNEVVPKLRAHVAENGIRIKFGTNEIFKKDKEALESFIVDAPNDLQVWFRACTHSVISLRIKAVYAQDGDLSRKGNWTAAYYEAATYLTGTLPEFTPWPIRDAQEWVKRAEEVPALREEIRSLESRLREITFITEGR